MSFLSTVADTLTATVDIGGTSIPFMWTIVASVSLVACMGGCMYRRRRRNRQKRTLQFGPNMEIGAHESPLTGQAMPRDNERNSAPPKGRRSMTHTISRTMARALHIPVSDWTEHRSENGTPYWVNRLTGTSTWNKPAELSPWCKSVDEHGRTYYYNKETGEARWTNPHHDEVGANEGLPLGWQKIEDSNGRSYYYEATTGVSQWEKPTSKPSEALTEVPEGPTGGAAV